jgi:hypothetical protein
MTGPQLFTEGLAILADARTADADADPREVDLVLRFATAYLLGALAAATAEASPRLVHNHNDRPSAWWTALHGEEGR